jgi:XTP/dITP diphosphohydrolase
MSISLSRLIIATHNPGKVHEIRTLLGHLPFDLLTLNEFEDVASPPETEDTYEGNAILKARYYAKAINEIVLADDSGLEVAALGGRPGVLSARYSGADASDEDRRIRLLGELAEVSCRATLLQSAGGTLLPSEDRSARFVCAAVVAGPDQEVLMVTEGICEGRIAFESHGSSGFGYDPIFLPEGYEQTFGELPESIKNRISHRAKALAKMRMFLAGEN